MNRIMTKFFHKKKITGFEVAHCCEQPKTKPNCSNSSDLNIVSNLFHNSIYHSFEEDVNSKEDSFKETEEAIPIDAIGQVKPIQLSELEDELNAWLNARFGRRQAQI